MSYDSGGRSRESTFARYGAGRYGEGVVVGKDLPFGAVAAEGGLVGAADDGEGI